MESDQRPSHVGEPHPSPDGKKAWLPSNVFLSHAREDAGEIEVLRCQLRARGLRAWRDVTELPVGVETKGYVEGTIRNDCDAFLLYLTESCLESEFIWSTEVPTAFRQYSQDPSFSIIPVFRSISPVQLETFCIQNEHPVLTDFNGVVPPWKSEAPSQLAVHKFLGEVAHRTLASALPNHFSRIGDRNEHCTRVWFRTFPFAGFDQYVDLDIDWTPYLAERVASAEEWSRVLLPALQSVKEVLANQSASRHLHVSVQARLAAAVSFGFAFRASTGFNLDVESRGVVYSTRGKSPCEDPLVIREEKLDGDPGTAAVAVSISRDVCAPAKEWIQERPNKLGALVILEPTSGPGRDSVVDSDHARAMARQIGATIARLNSQQQVSDSHLFLSAPAPLGIMIGFQLNACGRIHLYQRENGRYTDACILE